MANWVTFLVDGFNLYFSVRRAEAALRIPHLRWLEVWGLLKSYLYVFGPKATLEDVHFFPAARVVVAFPHARFNAELQQIADFSFRIRGARYAEHQLPDPFELPDGRMFRKPPGW